jgi:hypothetical protein
MLSSTAELARMTGTETPRPRPPVPAGTRQRPAGGSCRRRAVPAPPRAAAAPADGAFPEQSRCSLQPSGPPARGPVRCPGHPLADAAGAVRKAFALTRPSWPPSTSAKQYSGQSWQSRLWPCGSTALSSDQFHGDRDCRFAYAQARKDSGRCAAHGRARGGIEDHFTRIGGLTDVNLSAGRREWPERPGTGGTIGAPAGRRPRWPGGRGHRCLPRRCRCHRCRTPR